MKKYKLRWVEVHEATIEAHDEDEALENVEFEDSEVTKVTTTHEKTIFLGNVEQEQEFDQIEGNR